MRPCTLSAGERWSLWSAWRGVWQVPPAAADSEADPLQAASMGAAPLVEAGTAAEEQLTASLHRNTGVPSR